MQLSDISFLLTYVNGDPGSREDDIIPESRLYDYICRMIERLTAENGGLPQESLTKMIDSYTADYVETLGGARRRLNRALEIILTSYYANTLKLRADALVHGLRDR
jgi:hypothetical protein